MATIIYHLLRLVAVFIHAIRLCLDMRSPTGNNVSHCKERHTAAVYTSPVLHSTRLVKLFEITKVGVEYITNRVHRLAQHLPRSLRLFQSNQYSCRFIRFQHVFLLFRHAWQGNVAMLINRGRFLYCRDIVKDTNPIFSGILKLM